jgi:aspartate aminotransferase-like enzyme
MQGMLSSVSKAVVMKRRLYIPGPTWVDDGARQAMMGEMMGHRSRSFTDLVKHSQPVLQQLAGTVRPVYLATCSSWGMMEAALRNLVRPGQCVLNCCNGAFSDRWHDVSLRCGFEADALRVPWGQIITPELLRDTLEKKHYDLVTIVHAETSTGVLNPIESLAEVLRDFPDTMSAVDVVSSYSAYPLKMDEWGIDALMSGVQKALSLPPGLTICAISERALKRSSEATNKGLYFDFLEYEKNAVRQMTITTPNIPAIMGLAYRADEIAREGLEKRFRRHDRCRRFMADQAAPLGLRIVPDEGYCTPTLNCFTIDRADLSPAPIDTVSLVRRLEEEYGWQIDAGYGQWKGSHLRISNMGVWSETELIPLLADLSRCLDELALV